MVEIVAIVTLGLLVVGTLVALLYTQRQFLKQNTHALELIRSKSLEEVARYNATNSRAALDVEMLRDTFAKEIAQDSPSVSPAAPRIVHDVDGVAYNIDDLEVI